MTQGKHTPGPWVVAFDGGNGLPSSIRAPGASDTTPGSVGKQITRGGAITLPSSLEGMANANLMAAAPDLLAACKEFVRKCESGTGKSVRSYAEMKAAIAKAEGAQ